VPMHLRNAPTRLLKELGYGEGYRYAHDAPDGFVDAWNLPPDVPATTFYEPGAQGEEAAIRARLETWRARRRAPRGE
jgi:putative ATPase